MNLGEYTVRYTLVVVAGEFEKTFWPTGMTTEFCDFIDGLFSCTDQGSELNSSGGNIHLLKVPDVFNDNCLSKN